MTTSRPAFIYVLEEIKCGFNSAYFEEKSSFTSAHFLTDSEEIWGRLLCRNDIINFQ